MIELKAEQRIAIARQTLARALKQADELRSIKAENSTEIAYGLLRATARMTLEDLERLEAGVSNV